MKDLIQKLRDNRMDVNDEEWKRLSSMLDNHGKIIPNNNRKAYRRPFAIAATLIVLVGFGLWILTDPAPVGLDSPIAQQDENLMDGAQIALAEVNRLSHRAEMINRDEAEFARYSKGVKPYEAILPNGESWLVHMELTREEENCEATINSINDKAMQWQLDIVDEGCSKFSSVTADASVRLTTSNGEEKIILELREKAAAIHEKPLSLELKRIY